MEREEINFNKSWDESIAGVEANESFVVIWVAFVAGRAQRISGTG